MSLNEDQDVVDVPGTVQSRRPSLDSIISEGVKEPVEVLETLLTQTAPAPATQEEKHKEMEEKVVKECVREFSRGGMYFAYNFGSSST